MSFSGIGRPFRRSSFRTCEYVSAVISSTSQDEGFPDKGLQEALEMDSEARAKQPVPVLPDDDHGQVMALILGQHFTRAGSPAKRAETALVSRITATHPARCARAPRRRRRRPAPPRLAAPGRRRFASLAARLRGSDAPDALGAPP